MTGTHGRGNLARGAAGRLASPGTRVRGWPLPLLAGLLVAYLLIPLAGFVVRTAEPGGPAVPGLLPALATSLGTASIATALIGLTGIPLGYLLAQRRGWPARALGLLVQLPLALPPLMSGILLIYVVGPYTAVGRLTGGRLTDSYLGIVLAQVFVAAPFLVVAARSAFAAVDPALNDVAASLGHGPVSRFVRVALPAAGRGVRAGLLLAWLRAFGEFGATVILAYHPYTLPVFTYVQFSGAGLAGTGPPVAVCLVAALLVLLAADRLARRPRRGRRVTPAVPRPPTDHGGAQLSFSLHADLGSFRLHLTQPEPVRTLAILGPSGSGKSMTLRLLAGLLPGAGPVLLTETDGARRDVSRLAPEQRGIGYLPQDPALMPNLSVWHQATFGVDADPCLAAYWLRRLGLDTLLERYPGQLSGGQRRRVALARALARRPRLLLLDEPFTGLDTPVRDDLRHELRRLQRDARISTVLVTHDPDEAALLADHVLLLAAGRVLQQGGQPDVYAHPAGPGAARLLGIRNLNADRLAAGGELRIGTDTVLRTGLPTGAPVTWCVRPDRVELAASGPGPTGRVVDVVRLAAFTEVMLRLPGGVRLTAATTAAPPRPGTDCVVVIPPEAVTVWQDQSTSGPDQ